MCVVFTPFTPPTVFSPPTVDFTPLTPSPTSSLGGVSGKEGNATFPLSNNHSVGVNGATGSNSDGNTPCIVYRYPAALHASSTSSRNELYSPRTSSNTDSGTRSTQRTLTSPLASSFPRTSDATTDWIASPTFLCDSTRDAMNVRPRSANSSASAFPRKRHRRPHPPSFTSFSCTFNGSVFNSMLFA